MKKKKNKLIGKDLLAIDIGEHTTKMVVGRQERNGVRISQAFSFNTPRFSYEKAQIVGFEELKQAIVSHLVEHHVKVKTTVCSIESADIITREVTVPNVNESELEKMLEYEIQQYMPIALNEYVVQFKQLEEIVEEGVKKIRVLVTAMPRELARSYYELLESCGLDPAVLDIQSNAVDKLFCCDQKVNDETAYKRQAVAVLDLGHRHINVVILENGQFKFNRFLNQGARDINQNISHGLGVEMDEAESMKLSIATIRKGGLFDKEHSEGTLVDEVKKKALEQTRRTVDAWVEDTERVIKYYTTRSTGNVIDKVYVYGGVVQLNGLPEYLQEALNLPVERIESLSGINTDKVVDGPLSNYINALGNLIRR